MASLSLLLLSAALIHTAQSLPAGRDGGRGLDSAVRRQRRHLRDLLPYGDRMMSYPSFKAGSGANDVYYQPEDWRGRGLDQALQRLVEREQRRENEEEERAAYLSALLRLLSEAESVGLVGPGDVEVVEEVEEEDEENDQGPPGDFQDYDETGQRMSMGRPPAAWWSLVGPQQTQVLLDRMEPQLVKSLLQRAGQTGRVSSELNRDQDTLRRLVARILSSIGPDDVPVMRLAKRGLSFKTAGPVSSAHRRTRRSLDDMAPPLPSNSPPLLRVKRLEDEEEEEQEVLHTHVGRLQRMKRIDTMATADMEELNRENQKRRRRAAMNYDPQILISQILEYVE